MGRVRRERRTNPLILINGKDIYDDNYSNNPHSDVYKIIEDIEKNQ